MSAVTEQLYRELDGLQNDQGLINARAAVQWAREHPASALYKQLDWDDAHAAEEWRINQVRRLVAIRIVDGGGERKIISLSIDRHVDGGYRLMDQVRVVEDLRAVMLADALAELNRVRERYEHLTELAAVWAAAKAAAAKAAPRKKRGRPPKTAAKKMGGRKRAA